MHFIKNAVCWHATTTMNSWNILQFPTKFLYVLSNIACQDNFKKWTTIGGKGKRAEIKVILEVQSPPILWVNRIPRCCYCCSCCCYKFGMFTFFMPRLAILSICCKWALWTHSSGRIQTTTNVQMQIWIHKQQTTDSEGSHSVGPALTAVHCST